MLLYLGVIDILQSYKLKKRLEHSLKAIITDGVSDWVDGGCGLMLAVCQSDCPYLQWEAQSVLL